MIKFYIDALRKKSLNLDYESSKLVQQNTHQMSHIYIVRKTQYFFHHNHIKHIMWKLNISPSNVHRSILSDKIPILVNRTKLIIN